MSEHTQQPRTSAESPQSERQAPTEYVERSDVGVSQNSKEEANGFSRDRNPTTLSTNQERSQVNSPF